MTKVVPIGKAAAARHAAEKRERKARARGKTLCRSGHHKWEIDQKKQFDVQKGRLVTVRRCSRCGKTRTTLD